MNKILSQSILPIFLAAVFTVGLTFATTELPYVTDDLLQNIVATPDLDTHADDMTQFKTELFIGHYHLRVIGYACFALTVLLIIAGFATKRTGLATLGALTFMLPVFAQFAGVMFFLAGLGILNVLWLPVLDISFDTSSLGVIIRAPYDFMMWGLAKVGVRGYWWIVYAFIGGGLFIFFTGTWAWLAAKARKRNVADAWIYRFSRHPQYLGWILWSYGLYLLLMRQQYPRRSWGIDASLPWLVSTMVIIGVALLEEIRMRREYGEEYESYRRRAPFLLPLPRPVTWIFSLPFRVLFGHQRPQRKREVAIVMSLYTVLLIGLSVLFYKGGWAKARQWVSSEGDQAARMEELASKIREHPNWRVKYVVADRLIACGDQSVDYLIPLLQDPSDEVRQLAATYLGKLPSDKAVSPLIDALDDPNPNIRGRALGSLGSIGSPAAIEPMTRMLDDPIQFVRVTAARSLAAMGVKEVSGRLIEMLGEPEKWAQLVYIESLGALGAEEARPPIEALLNDESKSVRRSAVIALMKIGSPQSYDALVQATHDEDWEVRVYAKEALKRLEGK